MREAYPNELYHHGVKGQKWGVRRYQNEDGSLTNAGKKRYAPKETDSNVTKGVKKDLATMSNQEFKNKYSVSKTTYMKRVDRYGDPYEARGKRTALIVGASLIGTAVAAYGGYKLSQVVKNKAYEKSLRLGKIELERFLSKNSSKEFLEQPLHKLLYDRAAFEGNQARFSKARLDSKTLGSSIKTLAGKNGMSTAGLKSLGIDTVDIGYSDRTLRSLQDAFDLHNLAKLDSARLEKARAAASIIDPKKVKF